MLMTCRVLAPRFAWSRGVIVVLAALVMQGVFAVTLTAPKAQSNLTGITTVTATTAAGEQFNYAVLLVDAQGRCVTNMLPLRFDLDTRQYPDGKHLLRVDIADAAGIIASTTTVPVFFSNTLPPTPVKPAPTDAKPGKPEKAGKPVVALAVPMSATTVPCRPVCAGAPSVVVDGQPLLLALAPTIEAGHTMVLLRTLVETLHGAVTWDATTKQAVATIDTHRFVFTCGRNEVVADDAALVTLDRPVAIAANRMVVPISVWRELCRGDVTYQPDFKCVALTTRKTNQQASVPE